MSEVRLSAEVRTQFGKGGARRTRRAGKVPAVIYGHGQDPRHISLVARELATAIRNGGSNVLLTLDVAGAGEQLAIPKSIVRHPIKGYFEHVDLLAVRRGEKVTVDVPVNVVGEVVPGGLLNLENTSVSVEVEATNIPGGIEVDIAALEIGSQITAADLAVPAGATLITDPEALVLAIAEAPTAEEIEADLAEAADELGIVEDAPDEEAQEAGREADEAKAESTEPTAE